VLYKGIDSVIGGKSKKYSKRNNEKKWKSPRKNGSLKEKT
jgi:hypothetical protein